MDFQRTATVLWNRLRGFQPWPGAYTIFRGKKLNITAARPDTSEEHSPAGTLHVVGGRLLATCGQQTALEVLELQPEGKKRMPARDFINGYRPEPEERLGS
jgi:methionyl-tRNA formyltransferase